VLEQSSFRGIIFMSTVSQPDDPMAQLPQPRRRWTPFRMTILAVALAILLTLGGVAWWLISPLFVYNTGSANNPLATSNSSNSALTSTPEATPTIVPSGPVTLATGTFIDVNDGIHHGAGNVAIGKTADGKYILHMEQLDVTNGPDLYVYLSNHPNPAQAGQVTDGGSNLGRLHATKGSVNIEIPDATGMHLQDYKSVVIYCQAFSVIFTKAPLQLAAR